MRGLAQRLLQTLRKQDFVRPGDRVAAAVSGGADSVALLLLLEELRTDLGFVLSVAHVNHKLRGQESDDDERFVAHLATRLGLDLDAANAPIVSNRSGPAGTPAKSGIEAAARKLRYEFFRNLAERGRATKVATAHTLDDQAETVLLRIFRGTGIRGLAGIHPRLQLSASDGGTAALARAGKKSAGTFSAGVIRPLLTFRRNDLRDYLRARNETWREDSSNADPAFLRNRLRQHLLPLIAEEFGDASLQHLAELAEIARAEEEYWSASNAESGAESNAEHNAEAQAEGSAATSPPAALNLNHLRASPLAAQRRQVRAWLEQNAPEASISFALIDEVLELAHASAGKKLELPGGTRAQTVRRGPCELSLECAASANADYEYSLPIPGAVTIPELRARIEAQIVNAETIPEPECSALLDSECAGGALTIRNWRAGDRFWPAHTAREKKVKELLTDRHATGPKKKLWPVALNKDGLLVWMRGFPTPSKFQPRAASAICIRDLTAQG